jgi:Cys-tRNA synthase (O-phospho-L-seryl-tRNA:Cys-tRNA synthase)
VAEEAYSDQKVHTTGSFDVVAKAHKRRGFFFRDELKERGIIGELPEPLAPGS